MAGAHGWRALAVVLALVQTANSFHAPIALRHRELQSPVFSSQVAAAASPPLRRRTPPGPRAAALPAAMPAALSLLPPVATLAASIALKQTILAMVFGVWTGALLLAGGNPIVATLRTFDGYVLSALAGKDHAGVVVFTTILGGTIGIVQKSGGALGLAGLVKGFFTSRRRGALSTMALGSLVFFDDYSSVLIVGNSLRPLLSAVRLSAAKFAYITHTMAVVLASFAPLSSWVGIQIGYIAGAYGQLGNLLPAGVAMPDPFVTFLTSLPQRFFPWCMTIFVLLGALTGRDFGPMLEAERAALKQPSEPVSSEEGSSEKAALVGALDPAPGTPLRAVNALVPFGIVLAASFGGMVFQGLSAIAAMPAAVRPAASIVNSLRYADSVSALIWGSTFGWLAAMILVLSQRLLKLEEAMGAWIVGAKEVLEPMIILVLAWSLGSVIKDVGTAEFLASALQAGLPAWALPACIAALCYAISFASGSAIGTMGIVFPLVGPLAMRLGGGSLSFLHQCFGAIMGASVFGNLCSPLGDTSILTALATRCSLQLHISTVIGYTCLVALIALIFGDLAVGLGLYGPLAALGVCTALMTAIKLLVGRPVEGGKEQPA